TRFSRDWSSDVCSSDLSWIWVPIVFILLSIMDPLTYYYLPKIMDAVGGVPEGMAFEIPEIPAPDAVMLALVQISSIGVLIVVLRSEERRVEREWGVGWL